MLLFEFFSLLLFLCCPVWSEESFTGQESEFPHFFLRQFSVKTHGHKNVFLEDRRFRMSLLSEDMFFYDPLRKDEHGKYLRIEELAIDYDRWLLDANLNYQEIIPENKYYYDTMSQSYKRILVLLFGTPWLQETKTAIFTMKELYKNYCRQEMNRLDLIEQVHKWFKATTMTDTISTSVKEVGQIEQFYEQNPSLYEEQRNKLYSLTHGSALFFVVEPLHVFNLIGQIYELMSDIRFQQDVIFVFVSIGSEAADIQSFIKDVDIPFPILDDYNMDVSGSFVTGRIPIMTIVHNNQVYCEEESLQQPLGQKKFIAYNHEKCGDRKLYSSSKIAYSGDPLSFGQAKRIIDNLLFELFEQSGREIQEYYYQKRLKAYYEKIEVEERKKKEAEAQKRLAEREREAKKKEGYLGNR